jgi:L-rhamnose mutarotase
VEVEDEARWDAIAQTEPCRRWWAYMKDIMPSNPDNSPISKDLREVFHMD